MNNCKNCNTKFFSTATTTGYGITPEGDRICYACCTLRDIESMKDRSKPFAAYLSNEMKHISNWPGGVLGTVLSTKEFQQGKYRTKMYSVKVRDTHGGLWKGRGQGNGMYVRLTPCK